ncbi:MAG: type II toxin-antitoxin system HicB family antitoxin [Oligoflexia bacterium]|nr:type II toxin-antitoxin system HicB family antitoxin [Oligoflexia bacterium]
MKYHFKTHKEGKGYWAECLELSGCMTQAHSIEELKKNMEEALNLYLDEPADSKLLLPLPKRNLRGQNITSIAVNPQIAFAFYLRHLRLSHKMTQKEVANKMGFKNLYSYQRLEISDTANPQLSTLVLIKKVFPEFDIEEILSA